MLLVNAMQSYLFRVLGIRLLGKRIYIFDEGDTIEVMTIDSSGKPMVQSYQMTDDMDALAELVRLDLEKGLL